MRPSSLVVVTVCAVLPAACGKPEKKGKQETKTETTVAVAPKKVVENKALPALAADPGGATGKPVWQTGFGGLGIDSPRGIAVGSDGSVYIAGYIEGETDFGGTIGKKKSNGKSDAFVAKFGPDGKIAWAQTFGAAREDSANAIAIKGDKVVVAGTFLDTLQIGSFTKKSAGSDDLFIAAFDKDGNAEWLW